MRRAPPALLLFSVACQAYLPAWSPDGKSVAFVHLADPHSGDTELYVVTPGEDARPRLVACGAALPSWAEDGSLYFLEAEGAEHLRLVRLSPEGEREVVLDPPEHELKWYAPTQKGLYCILDPGGKLFYFDPGKAEFFPMTTAEGCTWACLGPDGKSLAVEIGLADEAEFLLLTEGLEKRLGKAKGTGAGARPMTFFERGVLVAADGGIRHLPFSGKGARTYRPPGGGTVVALTLAPAGEALVSVDADGASTLYAFSRGKWKKLGPGWGRTYDPTAALFAEYTEAGLHVASSDLLQHAYFPVTPEEELMAVLAHEKAGRLDEALAQAERALARATAFSAAVELARMRAHLRLNDHRQAARAFLRAYLVYPVSGVTDQEWDEAFKRVSTLTDRLIEELGAARRLKPSRAADILDRAQALEADPDMLAGLAFRTGLAFFNARRHVDAARRFRAAWDVESFPQRAHAAMMQAVSYFFAGKTALAAETLARASATLPESPLAPSFDRLRGHLLREGGRRKWTVEAKGSPYSARVAARPELQLEPDGVWVSFARSSTVLKEGRLFFGPVEGEVGRLTVSPDGKALAFLKRSAGEEAWEEACVVSGDGERLLEEKRDGILDCTWADARTLRLALAGGEEEKLELPPAD